MQTADKPKKPRFDLNQVIAGAQKRWRSDITMNTLLAARISDDEARHSRKMPYDGPYHDDGTTTLSMAVENALKLLRRHEDNKDYILSAQELKQRAKRQDAIGFGKAFMAQLKVGASVASLERTVNLQGSLRKCQSVPPNLAECFVRYMKDNKHIALLDPRDHGRTSIWVLKSKLGFTDDALVEMMQTVHTWFCASEPAPRPIISEEV